MATSQFSDAEEFQVMGAPLIDGDDLHRQYPDTFQIPSRESLTSLPACSTVKLGYDRLDGQPGERFWVDVVDVACSQDGEAVLLGELSHDLLCMDVDRGASIRFQPRHVLDVVTPADDKALEAARQAVLNDPRSKGESFEGGCPPMPSSLPREGLKYWYHSYELHQGDLELFSVWLIALAMACAGSEEP